MLEAKNICYSYHKNNPTLQNVSITVGENEFVGIIGPNGCGKSTLLKVIYKILHGNGEVLFEGKNVQAMSSRETAKAFAVVMQETRANFDFTVLDIVLMGRYSHKKPIESTDKSDVDIAMKALHDIGLEHLANRNFSSISGGEAQRVLIARALAQQTRLLILDEPTNHLDVGSQISTLRLLKETGKTILTALHDLNLAMRFCNRIYAMKDGKICAQGSPKQVITSELIKELYGTDALLINYEQDKIIHYL